MCTNLVSMMSWFTSWLTRVITLLALIHSPLVMASDSAVRIGRYSLIEAGDPAWRREQHAPTISYHFTQPVTRGEALYFILSDTDIVIATDDWEAFETLRGESLPSALAQINALPLDAALDLLLGDQAQLLFANKSVHLTIAR